jgi:hypothetical protein
MFQLTIVDGTIGNPLVAMAMAKNNLYFSDICRGK